MQRFTLISSGACSSDMLTEFWGRAEDMPPHYAQVEPYLKKTTFALVSLRDERPAYEFLLSKGWKDTGFYTGNSNGEMHLLTRGMKLTEKEPALRKVIRKRVKLPLSRLRKKTR